MVCDLETTSLAMYLADFLAGIVQSSEIMESGENQKLQLSDLESSGIRSWFWKILEKY